MRYTLTQSEQALARWIAERRDQFNREHGVVDKKQSDDNGLQIGVDGYGGELAFCRMRNLCPDFEFRGDKFKIDCRTRDGQSVDVKTTKNDERHTMSVCASKESKPCDWYAFLLCEWPTYTLLDVASKEEVFREENKRPNKKGTGYYYAVSPQRRQRRSMEQQQQAAA